MKSYTDLEQSKKLAEILSPESADMYYKYILPKSHVTHHIPEIGNPIDSLKWYNEGYTFRGKREPITLSEYCIPYWSLAALLKMLKNYQLFSNGLIVYIDNESYKINSDNPVDACVNMIILLKENKKL